MEKFVDIITSELRQHGYCFKKFLAEGSFGRVVLAEIMPDKLGLYKADADLTGDACVRLVAIKVINKDASQDFIERYLPRELENQAKLHSHKHVIRIYETMQTEENAYIVMDYCPNGDLVDYINKRNRGNQRGIGESEAKKMFKQLCEAVRHMHSASIVHRDLKCENIMLDKDHNVQLGDFGFSRHCNEKNPMMKTRCGTFSYSAPEVTSGKSCNGFLSDIWSLGVTLFSMVNGCLPYNHSQLTKMDEDMQMQKLKFQQNISSGCIKLIKKMLQFSPQDRPSIKEVLGDPWLFGQKPIPRPKLSRPIWETQCAPKVPEASQKASAKTAAGRTSDRKLHPASKKCHAGETVTLKSPLHCNKPKQPKRMLPTPSTGNAASSRPVQAAMTGQRAKAVKTRHDMDANDVIQAIMDRKVQLEDVRFANGARVTDMKQIPFWLVKEVLESNQQDKYESTDIHAVRNQLIKSGVGFTVQRKKSDGVSTVEKDTVIVSKQQQASPLCIYQQQRVHHSSLNPGVHHLPIKPKVPHPPLKDGVHHPVAKARVPYQLTTFGVRHPPATSNVRVQPPKPSVTQPPATSNVRARPPKPSVTQQPATSNVRARPPKPSVTQQPATSNVRARPPKPSVTQPPPTSNVRARPPKPSVTQQPATSNVRARPPKPSVTQPPATSNVRAQPPKPSVTQPPPTSNVRARPPKPSVTQPPPTSNVRARPPKPSMTQPPATSNVRAQPPKPSVTHPPATSNVRAQPPKPSVVQPPATSNVRAQPPKHSVTRPPKHSVTQPPVTSNVRARPPKPSVTHPPATSNVRAQPHKPGVTHPHFQSNALHQPRQHSVKQQSPTTNVPHPPATCKPAVQQQRRVILLNEDKKITNNLSPGMSKAHNMGKSTNSPKEAITQPGRKDFPAVTKRRRPEFELEKHELKQRNTNRYRIHLAERAKDCRGKVAGR